MAISLGERYNLMKRILCICNTYYQLLMGIIIKRNLFPNDYMAVIITDHSNNAVTVTKNVQHKHIFEDVFYFEAKDLDTKRPSLIDAVRIVRNMVYGCNMNRVNDNDENTFDLFLYYNYSLTATSIFANLYKKNPNIQAARYEEGILSYENNIVFNKKQTVAGIIRHMLGKSNLADVTNEFFCVYPDFYSGNLKTITIPKIDENDRDLAAILKEIFLSNQEIKEYSQKYIFFSSVCDFEGEEPIGEITLISKIAELVGNDNLIVKVHPRDDVSRFINKGFHVDVNSNAPWEAIQMNADFHDKIFLTVFSGGVLSINMLLKNPSQTFFLYPLCDIENNSLAVSSRKSVERLLKYAKGDNSLSWLHTADSLDRIIEK